MEPIMIIELAECLLIGVLIGLGIAILMGQMEMAKLDKEIKILDDIRKELAEENNE